MTVFTRHRFAPTRVQNAPIVLASAKLSSRDRTRLRQKLRKCSYHLYLDNGRKRSTHFAPRRKFFRRSLSSTQFKNSKFEKAEYRADILNANYSAQAARLSIPDPAGEVCIMARDGRCVNEFGSFSVAETNILTHHMSVSSPLVDGTLAVALYLFDGFHCRTVSRTVDYSEMD